MERAISQSDLHLILIIINTQPGLPFKKKKKKKWKEKYGYLYIYNQHTTRSFDLDICCQVVHNQGNN